MGVDERRHQRLAAQIHDLSRLSPSLHHLGLIARGENAAAGDGYRLHLPAPVVHSDDGATEKDLFGAGRGFGSLLACLRGQVCGHDGTHRGAHGRFDEFPAVDVVCHAFVLWWVFDWPMGENLSSMVVIVVHQPCRLLHRGTRDLGVVL